MSTEATDTKLKQRRSGVLAPRHRERQHGAPFGPRRPRRPQREGRRRPGRRVPARPTRVHPARQDHRRGSSRRRAPAHRWRPGHRQDDDGPPDGAQHRVGRPGQRPVHLLRARRAVPAQPADRDGVGARPSPAQDRRDQDRGRPQGDPRDVDGRGRRRRPAREQPAPAPVARPDRPLRPEPVPAARLADGEHDRQHAHARPAASRAVRRPTARGLRRLHAEGPADPGAGERDREGHVHRQRPQGHRPGRGRADGQHRRRRQGRPEGLAPAQLPPARQLGDQLRGRHHRHPQREVPHRRQGQHRVQPVPGAALPRLGRSSRSRRTAAARTTWTSSTRSTSSISCFDPNGRTVQEKLIEERLYND